MIDFTFTFYLLFILNGDPYNKYQRKKSVRHQKDSTFLNRPADTCRARPSRDVKFSDWEPGSK